MKHLSLELEKLEQRIAPGCVGAGASASSGSKVSSSSGSKSQGNNGYGNGGEDGVPGGSGDNDSPNAAEKEADIVR